MMAARELLIDLERTDLDALPPPPAGTKLPAAAAASSSTSSSGGTFDAKHRTVLLTQVDELRDSLLAEQEAAERLRRENDGLSNDVRSLASQLKQERAASNAVLKNPHPSLAVPGATAEAQGGELTLASAASQILLLRREVKFLQKQWNQARVDQSSATTREQMQLLRDEADEARKSAAAAEEATAAHAAKSRIALRELRAARGQVRAQQQRMVRRSNAQKEVSTLKEQLTKVHESFAAQQQTLKQLQLRERLRRQQDDDDDGYGGEASIDAAAATAEAAAAGLGLLVLANEVQALERAWMNEKSGAAELVAIKANMSFRVAQVEDDNAGLQAEVTKLRGRVAALQEEKSVMMGNLNALNSDLAEQPAELQRMNSMAAAGKMSDLAAPPPPPPPPPQPKVNPAAAVKAAAGAGKAAAGAGAHAAAAGAAGAAAAGKAAASFGGSAFKGIKSNAPKLPFGKKKAAEAPAP